MAVKPIPEGYRSVTPYLTLKGAAKAVEFYKRAFGAQELFRMTAPDGRLGHAELKIGDSHVMLSDEFPEMGGPPRNDGGRVGVHLYVTDADKVAAQAQKAGAKVTVPVAEMFWGDRFGKVSDPFGVEWSIATHVKDLSPEEIQAAAKKAGMG